MASCGTLERRNNSYIESVVKPCVSKYQKEILSLIEGKILKKGWGNRKKYPWTESGIYVFVCVCVCVCVRERERERELQLSNYCNNFKVYMKCKSPIQKAF